MIRAIIFILMISLTQLTSQVYDISDTSIKKHYFDSDFVIESGNQVLVGWDYRGGAIYSVDLKNIEKNKKYEVLYNEKDVILFSAKALNLDVNGNSIILAGGYFAKCLCGILLRQEANDGVWDRIYFDEIDNPYVSNINSISTNSGNGSKSEGNFGRVFLGCNNGIILYSDDSAKTFEMSVIHTGGKNISKIQFLDNKKGFALVGDNESAMNQLYFSIDYGATWQLYYDFSILSVTFKDFVLDKSGIDSTVSMCLVGSNLNEGVILHIPNIEIPNEQYFIENETSETSAAPFVSIEKLGNENQILILDENGILYNTHDRKVFTEIIKPQNPDGSRTKFNYLSTSSGEVIGIGMDGIVYKYVPLTSNLQNNKKNNQIRLNYNPVSKNIFITDENNLGYYSIQIFNIMGIMTQRFDNFSTDMLNLDFSEQPNGMYFYSIESRNHHFCGKFIKY